MRSFVYFLLFAQSLAISQCCATTLFIPYQTPKGSLRRTCPAMSEPAAKRARVEGTWCSGRPERSQPTQADCGAVWENLALLATHEKEQPATHTHALPLLSQPSIATEVPRACVAAPRASGRRGAASHARVGCDVTLAEAKARGRNKSHTRASPLPPPKFVPRCYAAQWSHGHPRNLASQTNIYIYINPLATYGSPALAPACSERFC